MRYDIGRSARFLAPLLLCGLVALIGGCNDQSTPTSPETETETDTTSPPPPLSSTGWLRAAQLTRDARTVDVAIDGEIVFDTLTFPSVSRYAEMTPGRHRIQFFPSGSTRVALRETFVELSAGESVTVAIATPKVEILVIRDDLSTGPSEARMKLVNAVEDFPAAFDLMVVNGPRIIEGVPFGASSAYEATVPGIYAFSLLRGGTGEEIAALSGVSLPKASSSTLFAVGSLARQDIQIFAARDR